MTRPSRSIIQQSFDARERLAGDASTPGYLNGDGFGLGWYSDDPGDPLPCVYRQARPAWNDGNLAMIAEKIYSPVLFAHVRAASPGMDVSETTCHPFRFGRYLWMHNGGLGGFHQMRRALLPKLNDEAFDFAVTNGSSDSALCFAVFLSLVPDKMVESTPDEMRARLDRTIVILRDAIREAGVEELSLLNFVVSDGDSLVVSRVVFDPRNPDAEAASLYYASGNSYIASPDSPGDYHMVHTDRRATLAIVSSEPLTEARDDWVSVPKNHILVITASMHILQCEVSQRTSAISRMLSNLTGDAASVHRNRQLVAPDPAKSAKTPGWLSASSEHHAGSDIGREQTSSSDPGAHGVLQRAISSQTMSRAATPPPVAATLSLRPSSSTIRYEIQTKEHSVLSMVVCGPYLCSGTQDGSIRVWHVEDRLEAIVLRQHTSAVLALAADEPASVLVSASSDSRIGLWRMSKPDLFQCMRMVSCSGAGDIFSLVIVKRTIFAGFSDTTLRRLDEDLDALLASSAPLENDTSDDVTGTSRAFARRPVSDPDRFQTAIPAFGSLRVNGITSGEGAMGTGERVELARHYGYIYSLASCMQGSFLCSGCGDGVVRVWNVESGSCIRSLEGHSGAVLALAAVEFSGSSLLFSGSRDGTVKVWDADSGFLCKRTLRRHKDEVVSCVSSGDIVLSGSADGQVYLWCSQTLQCLAHYRNTSLQAAAVSRSQELLFLASDDCMVQVRDLVQFDIYGNVTRLAVSGDASCTGSPAALFALGGVESDKLQNDALDSGKLQTDASATTGHCLEQCETILPGIPNEVVFASPTSPLTEQISSISPGSLPSSPPKYASGTNGTSPKDASRVRGKSGVAGGAENGARSRPDADRIRRVEERLLQDVFARFISFPTVSGMDDRREDCWQGAKYITTFLEGIGASVKMITPDATSATPSSKGHNPIVLARFPSAIENAQTLAFYGHYDVMPAEAEDWKLGPGGSDPWTLTAVDGHYYGRGATDNKGPILAMVFAIKSLLEDNKDGLAVNVVLVLEGEGEQSNYGFREALTAHRHWFGNTAMILTSNSCWLGEERPCITYGMRGVVDITVSVSGGSRNLHSGVDGGAIFEPVADLVGILSTLVDSHGYACVPGFYDDVRPLTDEDHKRLAEVQFELDEYRTRTGVEKFTSSSPVELLENRWRRPSISVASLDTSNKDHVHSVMPREATAKLSARFVPDQNPEKLVDAVRSHLELEFSKRRSRNKLSVTWVGKGDWWLGDPKGEEFQLAERAVRSVWGVEPLYVCEGGTMPIFSFLSQKLSAPVIQVPLGQASDGAHLPNERIRAMNLHRGKDVLRCIVRDLSEQQKLKLNK